ncbi:MAG: carbohydrate kinase family protein [Patescibacteria group bacterium]|nr:carbohydrate kinase family protein [Patescibacteria group bacterium]
MLDLLTFGHTTTDVFLEISEAVVKCDVNHRNCQICLDYAEKIPVKSFHRTIGGNAPNTAVGVSRLGLSVGIVSNIGKDANGDFVLEVLRKEKIKDLKYIKRDGFGTDYSTIINFKGERTILAFHEKRKYVFPSNTVSAKWGYLSSMGEDFEKFNEKFLDWAKKCNVKIGFNPGIYELKAGVSKIKNVLSVCELLIVNKEEAESLVLSGSITLNKDIKELLTGLFSLGPKIVVITDGKNGAYAYDGAEFLKRSVFPGTRVEMTGAGDSFSSGLLSALIYGKSVKTALRWGSANSSSVIQKVGAIEGLLTEWQMYKVLRANLSP